jgi:hypothetical protein
LSSQCATVVVEGTVTVAGGLYAPGHLGELTQYVPFELVDDVLELTRARQARLRMLPSRVGVYFTLALALFPLAGLRAGVGQADGRAAQAVPAAVGEVAA